MSHITQEELLAKESVFLIDGRIDLEQFLWIP
jgi:hypothetical protein